MQGDSIQDSTRYVVGTTHEGGILPGNRAEMWRDVYLRSGADVKGGIFGNNLSLDGAPIRVRGGVYVRGAIEISGEVGQVLEDPVDFNSVVTTSDSILIEDHCRHRVRFCSDIYAGQVKVHNVLVRGSIFAGNAIIRNSVILGGVFCTGKLTLENCVLGTFEAGSVQLLPNLMLLCPFAVSDAPITLDFQIKALSFVDLKKLLLGGGSAKRGLILADTSDLITVTGQMEDGEEERERHMISLGSRVLDLEGMKRQFHESANLLRELSLGDHLDPEAKRRFESGELAQVERSLFDLLGRPPDEEVVETFDLEAVKGRESVKEYLRKFGGKEEWQVERT